jgi:phage tail sheath gpL-like
VTALFRHKGEVGNSYDIRHSFRDGEALPAGVTLTITAMGGVIAGTTNPTLTNLIAAMTDVWFQIVTHPYTDATSLSAIEAEMLSRAGPFRSMDGIAITSKVGSFSTLTTLGNGRNSQYSVIVAQPGVTPLNPPMEFAAGTAGLIALAAAADPARPFQTLAFPSDRFLAPPENDQWSFDERNLFLFDGIATTRRAAGGVIQLGRIITTYQRSPAGSEDTSYLDATTVLTLLYLRFDFRTDIQNRFPRHKLANDDALERISSGQAIMTPKLGRAAAIDWFKRNAAIGLVEGLDQFKRDLVCERSTVDPNRLEWLLPPDLINFLAVSAAQIQFRL